MTKNSKHNNKRQPLGRHTSFCLSLRLTGEQESAGFRHCGAQRFARNQCLRIVIASLEAKKADASVKVPWSSFDLINAFNAWKKSAEAGVDAEGRAGLPWRHEVLAHVFEEGAADLAAALKNFSESKNGVRTGPKIHFPVFKKKHKSVPTFRLRNKQAAGSPPPIRFVRSNLLKMPVFGQVAVSGSTRKLRQLLQPRADGECRARITSVTAQCVSGRWKLRVQMEAMPFHRARCRKAVPGRVGVDLGLSTFAVVASASANTDDQRGEAGATRIASPKPYAKSLRKLRRLSRQTARRYQKHKARGEQSKNYSKSVKQVQRLHRRVQDIRRSFLHEVTCHLVKTHEEIAIEDLHVRGMQKNRRLARHIADASWGIFSQQLEYKAAWYGTRITQVDRFFPSSKTCSRCGCVKEVMALSERRFTCSQCGMDCCRDLNAAVNLARWQPKNENTSPVSKRRRKTAVERFGAGRGPKATVKPTSGKQKLQISV